MMYIRLRGLNKKYVFPYGSGGWKAKMPWLVSDKTFFEAFRQPPSSLVFSESPFSRCTGTERSGVPSSSYKETRTDHMALFNIN